MSSINPSDNAVNNQSIPSNFDSTYVNNTHLSESAYLAPILRRQVLKVRGARTHNLKNIDVDIPKHSLTVITGVSGSGKSSLAFDTLYAEGQRRYVESLSAYARQFLQLMDKPDVDLIEGLSPAISIEQKASSHNPRSTVGTVTEIHDYLRLLFARAGTAHCPKHPKYALKAQSISQMVDTLLSMPNGTQLMILAPIVNDAKGTHQDLIKQLQAQGFVRLRLKTGDTPARLIEIDQFPVLKKTEKHTIEVVIDRIKIKSIVTVNDTQTTRFTANTTNHILDDQVHNLNKLSEQRQRLAESLETALRLAKGKALVMPMDNSFSSEECYVFSNRYACPECGFSLKELEPRLFSFNNPAGACEGCNGLGEMQFMDPLRIVMQPHLSLANGAIKGWDKRNMYCHQLLECIASYYQFDIHTPWKNLPIPIQNIILNGTGDIKIPMSYLNDKGNNTLRNASFEGVIAYFERRYKDSDSHFIKEELARYINTKPCQSCHGTRLKADACYVKLIPIEGNFQPNIHELSAMTLADSLQYLSTLKLPGSKGEIADRIIREIIARLTFLNNVGLTYLNLTRNANSLSGGEIQRIRLASQIGSGLTGVMYVLDEPSIGLHQRDNDRLIATLQDLRNLGNTVLVVEHDEDMIRAADCVIDIGPGAGEHGGNILALGTAQEIISNVSSITADYLAGRKFIEIPKIRHLPTEQWIRIFGASSHNLKKINVNIPIGLFTCITGVSGSGKSTLINDTLYKASAKIIHQAYEEPAIHTRIDGLTYFDKVINVDQSAIGRTPRSNPATYTGLFTPLRELFANTNEAKSRGYAPGRFSFNVKGGRCESCQGDGVVKVAMHFLPDIYVPCDTCEGKRYNRETLDICWKGMNIADVLNLTVEEAYHIFSNIPTIRRKLATLMEVGLSYIRLGQNAITLSGGEAQRVKLSLELSKRDTGNTLYILDEPTTGLHFHDIAQLLKVIHKLRDSGNTLVVIEHNLDVIKTADWLIDMGPEGGKDGGYIVAEGTPETVANNIASYTGQYLKKILVN